MGGKREGAGRKPATKYKPEYCELIIKRMAEGALDIHLQADLNISATTFTTWQQKYPAFREAYEIGFPKCYCWWLDEGKKKYPANYWISIMKNKFNWTSTAPNDISTKTTNTQINIGAINVMKDKSSDELRQLIKEKLEFIELVPQERINNEKNRFVPNESLGLSEDGRDADGVSGQEEV